MTRGRKDCREVSPGIRDVHEIHPGIIERQKRAGSAVAPPFVRTVENLRETVELLNHVVTGDGFGELKAFCDRWHDTLVFYPQPEQTTGRCLVSLTYNESRTIGVAALDRECTSNLEELDWICSQLRDLLTTHERGRTFLEYMAMSDTCHLYGQEDVSPEEHRQRKARYLDQAIGAWAAEIQWWLETDREPGLLGPLPEGLGEKGTKPGK